MTRPLDETESTLPDEVLDMNEMEGQVVVALEKTFAFDAVFDANSCQATVYGQAIQDLVTKFVYDTANVTVMAYGQTGAGKTHTMIGTTSPPGDDDRGVIPRAIEDTFATIDEDTDTIKISFFEILNEKIYDLLKNSRAKVPLTLRQEGHRFLVGDLTSQSVASVEEAVALLSQGCAIRSTGATAQNETSSRSHAVLRMELFRDNGNGDRHEAKMSLVDLAGSESVRKTQASGERLAEANNINRGLLALGNCISDICTGKAHIPFRNSTLTKVLKDSLEGKGCWTSMIACVSPAETDLTETLNTLRYADRAKQMKKPAVPPHLLKHAQAQAKKRRLAQMIPPTPAHFKRPKLNSTIETPTPTKRKKPRTDNRLNSTTPVRSTHRTPGSGERFARTPGSGVVRNMDNILRDMDENIPEDTSVSFSAGQTTSSGGGKLGHNLGSAGGSCSDISSIGGADNLAGGRATSSVVSGPSYNPVNNTMSTTLMDASMLSPMFRKFTEQITEKITEQLEQKFLSKLEETMKLGSQRRSPRLSRTQAQASAKPTGLVSNAEKKVVIDKARASITELVEHNLRKHRQSEQGEDPLRPRGSSISTDEIIKCKPVLGELNHRKKHLQRVEQTTSPTLRRSVGGSVISDGEDSVFLDNKENAQNTSNDRTLTTSNVSETPVKTPSDQEIQNPPKTPLTLAEMTMAMGIDMDSPGMKEIFESPAQKPPPLNRKKSSRRTTMMQPELRQSLRKSCLTHNMKPREEPPKIEGGTAGNRRRSSRIAASSQPATESKSDDGSGRKSDFKQPLQVTKNWKVSNQDDHNKSLLRLLNTANLKMLQSLPTVGPKTAYLIHSHRELHNGFKDFNELKTVPGLQKNFFDRFIKVHQIVLPEESS